MVNQLEIKSRNSYMKKNFVNKLWNTWSSWGYTCAIKCKQAFLKKKKKKPFGFVQPNPYASHNNDSILSAISITDTPNIFS